jgi:hypothetical protein
MSSSQENVRLAIALIDRAVQVVDKLLLNLCQAKPDTELTQELIAELRERAEQLKSAFGT